MYERCKREFNLDSNLYKKSDMNIKKISLQNAGFSGATVVYLREEEKNGHPFINEVTEKRKHPVHFSLEKMFKDLRYHLLIITQLLDEDMSKEVKDQLLLETEVTGIEFDAASFVITGEKRRFGDKYIKLKTCKVDDNDLYEHFDTVQSLIQSIVEETKEYLAGTKKVDDVEVLRRWVAAGKSKELTEESLANYTSDQLKEFAVKLIESKFGGIVFIDEAAEISAADVEEVNAEIQAAQEVVITGDETVIPLPPKEEKKKSKKKKEEVVEAEAIELKIPVTNNVQGPAF